MGVSFEEFAGQPAAEPEVVADATPSPKPEAQPTAGMSFDDFAEGRTPAKQMLEDLGIDKRAPRGYVEKGLNAMKSAGGNTAVLADMVLSAPWFAMSIGANWGNKLTGMALGQDWKTAAQSGRRVQEEMMTDFGNPLHQLMRIIDNGFGTHTAGGYSDNTVAELFGKVSSLIDQAGEWVEKKSDGKIPSEEVANMADGLMLLTGAKGGDMVKRLWDMRKNAPKDYVPPEVSPEQTQKQGPRYTAQQDVNKMLNIRSTRDRKAYEQKRRREVRDAFNTDSPEQILPDGRRQGGGSDFADYLKFVADERVSNHDNWNKSAREQEAREQAARASEDPAVPKPAEPTPQQIGEILNKSGVERTSEDLLKLRRFNEGAKETPWVELKPDEVLPPGMDIKMNMRTGKNYYRPKPQSGFMRPELAARLAAFGLGATAGLWLDPEDPIQASLLGGAALVAPTLLMGGRGNVTSRFKQAGAVKGPGGMWHPEAVERLTNPLYESLADRTGVFPNDVRGGFGSEKQVSTMTWAEKAIRNYLNKYAGTERDPLAGVEIPFGDSVRKWSEVSDATFKSVTAAEAKRLQVMQNEDFATHSVYDAFDRQLSERFNTREEALSWADKNRPTDFDKAKPEERIWATALGHKTSAQALTSYLSHVGDYLRQNVPAEKLGQYDLVRAVRETAANDARVAKEMEKAQAASTKDLPVHKEYPDGMKWVDLKLPEKLTPEQVKTVRIIHEAPPGSEGLGQLAKRQYYEALDQSGKPIKNNYTGESARSGRSPEEAWLAGKLAEEGNAMGHCVGGYCASVAMGDTRIYSLRDSKGKSHVTVEIQPRNPEKVNHEGPPPEDGELTQAHMRNSDDITQIKGKQNRAPNPEYLPYVQDFVKSGKWGEVGDFENTGLWKNSKGQMFSDAEIIKRAEALHKESNGKFPKLELEDLKFYKGEVGAVQGKAHTTIGRVIQEALELGVAKDWQSGARGRQEGSVDIKTAAKIAGLAGGAAVGASMADNKVIGTILGGLTGLMIGGASPKGVASVFRKVWAPDKRIRVEDNIKLQEYQVDSSARAINQVQTRMENLVPKEEQRQAISHAIESGDLSTLSPRQQEGARIAQATFAELAKVAQDQGVLKDAIMNYVTHIWKPEKAQSMFDEIFGKKSGFNMSPETRFALKRSVPTLAEGKAKGLVPVTEDISTILGIYGNAISRALANKQLIISLREAKTPDGQNLLQPSRKAPASYVRIEHPQMMDVRVHPDIAPSLRFIFDNYNPTTVMRGIEGLNMLSKRMNVSFSLFHDKALTDAYVGGSGLTKGGIGSLLPNVPGAALELTRAFLPKTLGGNKYLQELKTGGAGDLVDTALKAGLKFQLGREGAGVEDVTRGSFYSALRDLQAGLDSVAQGAGSPVKGFIKLNHYSDKVMWERLHAGSKLNVFAESYNKLLQTNAKAHERNPQVPLLPKERLAEQAASYANDIFGGINWRAVAENVGTVWGRDAALALLSPAGRRVGQLLLFAPDWTLSTTRAAIKAFGVSPSKYVEARDAGATVKQAAGKMFTGTGAQGLLEPQTVTDLHRQYLVRSAIYYVAVGDAINYAMSGHHLWENKDPTTIDLGDGRRMQWSKHTMEPVHWLTKPMQQAANKLGFYPREIINQISGKDYISAYGTSPAMGNRAAHIAKNFLPISVQPSTGGQGADVSVGSGIASFLGTPIYGKTYAERQMLKEQRRMSRRLDYKPREPK